MSSWLLSVVVFLVFTAFWNLYHVLTILALVGSFSKKAIKGKVVTREEGFIVVEVPVSGKSLYVSSGFYYKNCGKKLALRQLKDIIDSDDKELDVFVNKKDIRKSSLTNPELINPLRYMASIVVCIVLIIFSLVNL